MRIDMHSHIIPEHLPRFAEKFGYEGFIHLDHHKEGTAWMMKGEERFREINSNCWDPQKRFEDMERTGIDMQVICTIPVMFSYWAKSEDGLEVARFLNDDVAATVQAYPNRFIGLGTLPMQAPESAAKELERCVRDLGLKGVQIGSNINGTNLNDPSFQPVFETAERLGASILVHPWEMIGRAEMPDYWMPWLVGMPAETSRAICSMIFGGVFEQYPGLRVCFSHGGGSFPGTIGRIEHGFNSRPDLVAVSVRTTPSPWVN
ncbi:MAG: amidohydrolase family protein [Flavobacteriales bacterium]